MSGIVRFADGSAYCDAGREVQRIMFWRSHKDDNTICAHPPQPTLADISNALLELKRSYEPPPLP